jgi:hypothetical protein
MDVLDLVQSAAFKSGIVSSFSQDDMPGDVLDAGIKLLSEQILPQLNCDRTIDITTTCRIYAPEHGRIVLKPLKQPRQDFVLLGYSQYTADDLFNTSNSHWPNEIDRLHPGWDQDWPVNDFGEQLTLAMWSKDTKLVYGTSRLACTIGPENVDFTPMRVEAVIDIPTGEKLTYLYRDEFEQIITPTIPGVYALEEYDDVIAVFIKGRPGPKKLILPVPLTLINHDQSHAGEIIAPPKFRKYLIDATAVQLAIVYGVATADAMRAEAAASYNMLKKNHTQPLHGINVPKAINDIIRGRSPYLEGPWGIFGGR